MSMPSGSAGLDAPFTDWGQSNTLSSLATYSKGNIESHYMGVLQGNGPLGAASSQFFDIILGGFESLTNFLQLIVQSITGAVGGTLSTLSGFMAGVINDIANSITTIGNLAYSLLHDAGSVIGSIPQAIVSGLTGALNGLGSFIQSVINAIWGALRGIPILGAFVPGAPELAAAVSSTQVQQQNATITVATDRGVNELWRAPYAIADVTYPEIMHTSFGVQGTTSSVSGHTHDMLGGGISTNFAYAPIVTAPSTYRRGGYIRTGTAAVYDTVAMYLGVDGSINNLYLEVFREDSSGALTRISSNDVSSIVHVNSPGFIAALYLEVPLSSRIIAQTGERYVVSFRNSTTNSAIVYYKNVNTAPLIRFAVTGSAATQTSYTTAEAVTARGNGGAVPWGMLAAKNVADADVSYSDDANRANLGPFWYTSGAGDIVISNDKFVYGGTATGDEHGLYTRRTSGDKSRVDANLHVDAAATTQQFGLLHSCNRDLSQFVYLSVTGTDAKIYSFTGGVLTQQATVAVGGTDTYSLYYDVPNDKYVALKGGAAFSLEWTGVSTTVLHGEDYRFGGMRISYASSHPGGQIDNWTLRDWAP